MEWQTLTVCSFATLFLFCTTGFGIFNFWKFKAQIYPNLPMRMFYVYGLLCCVFLMAQVWQNPLNWYELQWLIPNTIIKNCEICFAWCQTLAFIILIIRMKSCEDSNCTQDVIESRLKRVDVALVVGLVVTNVLFWVFIAFLIQTNAKYKNVSTEEQKLAR